MPSLDGILPAAAVSSVSGASRRRSSSSSSLDAVGEKTIPRSVSSSRSSFRLLGVDEDDDEDDDDDGTEDETSSSWLSLDDTAIAVADAGPPSTL